MFSGKKTWGFWIKHLKTEWKRALCPATCMFSHKFNHYWWAESRQKERSLTGALYTMRLNKSYDCRKLGLHGLGDEPRPPPWQGRILPLNHPWELTPKTDVLFIIGDWNAKVRSQETPGVAGTFGLGVQNEAKQRLTEFRQKNALVIANTLFQQHKRRLCTWTSPDGHQNQTDYIHCSQRWRSSIQTAKTRQGADCGSYHELLIAKFRLKLKKVGKTTRPFRYDLNQIPYDCTVEVRNRFKGLYLIECLMNYGWRFVTLYRTQGSRPSPWKSKMAVWEGLTHSSEKKGSEKQRRKGKIFPFECRDPKNIQER